MSTYDLTDSEFLRYVAELTVLSLPTAQRMKEIADKIEGPARPTQSAERAEKALCWFDGLDPKINPEASYGLTLAAEVKHLRAQLAEWNRIKALFREEAHYRKDSRNPYGNHGHQVSGIRDSDNGPLAGHECAACAAARAALGGKESGS